MAGKEPQDTQQKPVKNQLESENLSIRVWVEDYSHLMGNCMISLINCTYLNYLFPDLIRGF